MQNPSLFCGEFLTLATLSPYIHHEACPGLRGHTAHMHAPSTVDMQGAVPFCPTNVHSLRQQRSPTSWFLQEESGSQKRVPGLLSAQQQDSSRCGRAVHPKPAGGSSSGPHAGWIRAHLAALHATSASGAHGIVRHTPERRSRRRRGPRRRSRPAPTATCVHVYMHPSIPAENVKPGILSGILRFAFSW